MLASSMSIRSWRRSAECRSLTPPVSRRWSRSSTRLLRRHQRDPSQGDRAVVSVVQYQTLPSVSDKPCLRHLWDQPQPYSLRDGFDRIFSA